MMRSEEQGLLDIPTCLFTHEKNTNSGFNLKPVCTELIIFNGRKTLQYLNTRHWSHDQGVSLDRTESVLGSVGQDSQCVARVLPFSMPVGDIPS